MAKPNVMKADYTIQPTLINNNIRNILFKYSKRLISIPVAYHLVLANSEAYSIFIVTIVFQVKI